MRKGAPARRSRSVCSQARMLPRSTPSGELWKSDAAGQVHAECYQLVARPTDIAHIELRGRPDFLHEPKLALEPIEPIARPRERHEARQLRDVAHIEPDVNKTAAMPPERVDLTNSDSRTCVELAECLAIEARLGVDAQRRAA